MAREPGSYTTQHSGPKGGEEGRRRGRRGELRKEHLQIHNAKRRTFAIEVLVFHAFVTSCPSGLHEVPEGRRGWKKARKEGGSQPERE